MDPFDKYLECIITDNKYGGKIFDPWLIMENPELLRTICELLSLKYESVENVNSCCILADSGMPIGIFLAQNLSLGMHFYRRSSWMIDDETGPRSIYPKLNKDSVLPIIDSHITTGFTAGSCIELLKYQDVGVDNVITVVNFQTIPNFEPFYKPQNLISGVSVSDKKEIVFKAFGIDRWEKLPQEMISSRIRSKSFHFENKYRKKSQVISNKSKRFFRIIKSLSPFLGKLEINYIDDRLSNELNKVFPSAESGVWNFFTFPDEVKKACLALNKILDFNSHQVLVATDYLGLIFTLCIAWHNNFSGKILSTKSRVGWDNVPPGTDCIICSARIQTGYSILATLDFLSQYKFVPSKIVALRYSNEQVEFPRNKVIEYLVSKNIPIYALS